MLEATFRPRGPWPGPETPSSRRKSTLAFRASWSSTLDLLEQELRAIRARDLVIQLDVEPREIRNDGWPRSDASPRSPGVILSFTHPKHETLVYRCDRYRWWQHNRRAIGLTLEALRAVSRYGAVEAEQQYAGFRALPELTGATMTTHEAAGFLAAYVPQESPESLIASAEAARRAARAARAREHPDAGGNEHRWHLAQLAIAVLARHHGVTL
jgi:hypothetical protein